MPFHGKHSCYSFTPVSVRQNAPPSSGVYALSNAGGWIYIGAADDMQAALRAHLAEVGTPLRTSLPTGFTCELCDSAARPALMARLIRELSPSCNPNARN